MTSNDVARRDSTLLSLIGQALARGAPDSEIDQFASLLKLESSREQAKEMRDEFAASRVRRTASA